MSAEPRPLTSYVVVRLAQSVLVVLGIVTLAFVMVHFAPGDPAMILAGEMASDEYLETVRRDFGLDKPLHEQFYIFMANLIQGRLGYSFLYRRPAMDVILARLPNTILLVVTELAWSSIVGIILGVKAAQRPFSKTDYCATIVAVLGYAVPVFWVGQILIITFSINLPLFPTQGMTSVREELTGLSSILDLLHHLFLPALALGLINLALIARLTRASTLEALSEDYILTARSKGLPESRVLYRHAFRNALLPVVTVIALNTGYMMGGAVLTETVFAWPGVGRLLYDSISIRDYSVIIGVFIVISVAVVMANLVADILYQYLDPRVRYR